MCSLVWILVSSARTLSMSSLTLRVIFLAGFQIFSQYRSLIFQICSVNTRISLQNSRSLCVPLQINSSIFLFKCLISSRQLFSFCSVNDLNSWNPRIMVFFYDSLDFILVRSYSSQSWWACCWAQSWPRRCFIYQDFQDYFQCFRVWVQNCQFYSSTLWHYSLNLAATLTNSPCTATLNPPKSPQLLPTSPTKSTSTAFNPLTQFLTKRLTSSNVLFSFISELSKYQVNLSTHSKVSFRLPIQNREFLQKLFSFWIQRDRAVLDYWSFWRDQDWVFSCQVRVWVWTSWSFSLRFSLAQSYRHFRFCAISSLSNFSLSLSYLSATSVTPLATIFCAFSNQPLSNQIILSFQSRLILLLATNCPYRIYSLSLTILNYSRNYWIFDYWVRIMLCKFITWQCCYIFG